MSVRDDAQLGNARLELPQPTRERFQPLRAGICNLWEYDDQELWFHDGRLILRGANEAGKSKALELLMPFLLDADLRPQRLDPFGEKSKDMFWNLIGFDAEKVSALGYCWMELGRLDENGVPRYVTIGAGLRATRGGGLGKPWYFVTRRRIREDLSLLDGRTPLTQEKLEAALGADGDVYTVARDYRAAVDRALFELGPDRYAALIHLLLQLRKPHLSDKLDPASLSTVLTASLPPLEEARIGQLAGAFDSLDAEAEALTGLEQARDAVLAFREEYRAYARLQARRRAAGLRSAVTKLDAVTKRVRKATDDRDKARESIRELDGERTEKKRKQAELEGRLRGLEESAEMREARRLDELRQGAQAARTAADRLARQREEAKGDLDKTEGSLARHDGTLRTAAQESTEALRAAANAAAGAALSTLHGVHAELLSNDPIKARAALEAAIDDMVAAIGRLRAKAKRVEDENARVAELRRSADDVGARRERAEEDVRQAEKRAADEESALELGIREWEASLEESALSGEDVDRLVDEALTLVTSRKSCAPLGPSAVARRLTELDERAKDAAIEQNALETRKSELQAERDRVASERDDGPAPRAGRALDREGRGGAALWQLCDFAEGIADADRAAVEAALEAAGLLDAWVTPDGRVHDPDTFDVVLVAGETTATGRTLADVIVAAPSADVSPDAVRRLLRQISIVEAGEEPTGPAWITMAGHWGLGPLRGRWRKEAAEHIGAATRAAARTRRLARIDEELRGLAGDLERLAEEAALLRRRQDGLKAAAAMFPAGSELLRAHAELESMGTQARRLREELASLQRDLLKATERLDRAICELRKAAETAGLLDALGDLDGRAAALEAYRRVLGDASAASRRYLDVHERHSEIREQRDDFASRVAELTREAAGAEAEAQGKAAEAAAFEEKVGVAAAVVMARRDVVKADLGAIRKRLDAIATELNTANRTLGEAETELSQADHERGEREQARADAIEQLSFLAGTELLGLAVPDLMAGLESPPWAVKLAVELARRVETQTSDVATDEPSANKVENQTYDAFNKLRAALGGDFDPTQSRERDLLIITVRHNARVRGVGELAHILAEEVAKRRALLEREERAIIERHLLGDVGLHLQERLAAARRLIDSMNEQLAAHPTNSGITVRLRWTAGPDAEAKGAGAGATPSADADVAQALELLRRDVRLLVDADQDKLVQFLRGRITEARHTEGAGLSSERMARALDYRHWHHFRIVMIQGDRERVLTKKEKGTGSGGSKAILVHLPLFAAASAHYRSARPWAPHLIMLDEAFDGVDRGQRGNCMGLLAQFDLDFMITNYEEWGCYEELPGVATYHLSRTPGQPGVAALRFVWDGHTQREDDTFLQAQLAGVI